MLRRRVAFGAALALALSISCAAGPGERTIAPDAPRSAIPIARLFPLQSGYVYSYITQRRRGRLILAHRARLAPRSHVGRAPLGIVLKTLRIQANGVVNAATGTYLLKAPLAVGASWRGEHGLMRVTSVDASPSVAAGRFAACVETVEERGGDIPVRFTTVFCPDVGIVTFDVEAGRSAEQTERTELRSYAPGVDLGPEGLTITKP